MKTLKALLLLVVFCLTVSGSTYDVKPQIDDTYQIDKNEIEVANDLKNGKMKLPSQQDS